MAASKKWGEFQAVDHGDDMDRSFCLLEVSPGPNVGFFTREWSVMGQNDDRSPDVAARVRNVAKKFSGKEVVSKQRD